MRTGALSDERIIKFLNDNFINTWVTNADLGRIPSLQDPIAKRREREYKTFDTNHALAKAIIKGWNKYSPVDCLVFSHKFELMGSIHYNLFIDGLGKSGNADDYLLFLKESLERRRPGLRPIFLSSRHSSQEVLDLFQTSTVGYQEHTVIGIDTSAFKDGGTITIDIETGRGKVEGEFCLYDSDNKLSTEERLSEGKLASVWIQPKDIGQITYSFDQGQIFELSATGHREEKEVLNAFHAKISVERR